MPHPDGDRRRRRPTAITPPARSRARAVRAAPRPTAAATIAADARAIVAALASFAAVATALLVSAPGRAEPGAGSGPSSARVALRFVGSIARLRIMTAEVDADLDPTAYAGAVTFQSAGLAGFFKTARIEGRGAGVRMPGGFAPETYTHVEVNGRKRREVDLTFLGEDVSVDATPPFGSFGDPAPTPAQKREALDPLAMVLQVALAGGADPCSRVVPVFDSKLRYDLEFHPDGDEPDLRTRGYRGPAQRCLVYYRPIAGYDPEDLAEDEVYATPIRLWLAEVAPGVTAPALIRARFDAGVLPFGVKLELTRADVISGG